MKVKCLWCGGWADWQGLRDVSTEHAPNCGDVKRAHRLRVLKETNGRVDIFATCSTIYLGEWQTSGTKPEGG